MRNRYDSERCLLHMLMIYAAGAIAALIIVVLQHFVLSGTDKESDIAAVSSQSVIMTDESTEAARESDAAAGSLSGTGADDTEAVPAAEDMAQASSDTSDTADAEDAADSAMDGGSETVSDDGNALITSSVRFNVAEGTGSLNIRSKPDKASQSLGRLDEGESGDVIEQGDTWSLIKTDDDIYGYVMNKYIVTEQ